LWRDIPLQGLVARRVLPVIWAAAAALTLSAGVAQANSEANEEIGGDVDFLQLMAPSLGSRNSGFGDKPWGWSDSLYRHPRYWISVTGGNSVGEGFVRSSLNQIMFGDVTATSSVRRMRLVTIPGSMDNGAPRIIVSATAIGNMSAIDICTLGNCGTDAADPEVAPDDMVDGEQPDDSGKPAITVTSVVDGSDGDVTPDVNETDTRTQGATSEESEETEEEVAAGSTEESQAVKATEDEGGLNFDLVMIPSFGSGIGAANWWFPGLGALAVHVAPEVPLLSRVLVERNQLIIGNVVATASVDKIKTEVAEAELPDAEVVASEAVADEQVTTMLPDIALNAVAVGNSSAMTSDIGGVAIDRQIVIGSVDSSIDMPSSFGSEANSGTMSSVLLAMMSDGMIEKAQITAEVSADQYDGVLSELNATAIANSNTVDAMPDIGAEGLVVVELLQFSYGDAIAKSSKGPADITGEFDFSSVATAVGNMANFKLANPFN